MKSKTTGRRRKICKQLLDDFKKKRGYWQLKEEALDRTLWRTHLEQTRIRNEWGMNYLLRLCSSV